MSVLVQRPQMPGIIVLPRHSSSPANHRNRPAQPQRHHTSQVAPAQVAVLSTTNKPSRRQRGQLQQPPSSSSASPSAQRSTPKNDKRRSHQPAQQVTDSPSPAPQSSVSIISGNSSSSSSATVSASHSPVLSSASSPVTNQTTPATTPPTSSPTLANSTPNAFNTPPRKAGRRHQAPKSAPNTPTPANSLPVPANRRRARSPRPTQKLPGLNLEELVGAGDDDSFPSGTPAKKNNKKVKALVSEPATWQQAALLNSTGALTPLIDSTTAVAHPSMTNPPSPTRTSPPKGSVFDIAFEHGLTHSITMPNLATPNRRTGGLHTRAPSVPSYSTFPAAAKPSLSLEALFSGLAVDSAPATPAAKATGKIHTRGQSVSSSLPPSTSLHARMAAAAASTSSSASRRERTLTGNAATTPGAYIKFAGASFQTAPDAMMLPRPAFGGMGMFGRRGSSQSGSSDEDSEEDERAVVDLSEEEETGVFAF